MSRSPSIPSIVEHRTLCPFIPCLVAMVGLICLGPALDAVSVMLAKEAEDMRDRNRLLGLSFLLYRPGLGGALDGTPSESLTHLQSCRPRCRATHCTILGAISPCCAASLGPPSPLWGGGRAPKQHRPFFPCLPPPQRDLTFFLDCLY